MFWFLLGLGLILVWTALSIITMDWQVRKIERGWREDLRTQRREVERDTSHTRGTRGSVSRPPHHRLHGAHPFNRPAPPQDRDGRVSPSVSSLRPPSRETSEGGGGA